MSFSIYKRSRAQIDKLNNLTTIKMDLFTLSKTSQCVKARNHRNSLSFPSRAEVTQRCLSQQQFFDLSNHKRFLIGGFHVTSCWWMKTKDLLLAPFFHHHLYITPWLSVSRDWLQTPYMAVDQVKTVGCGIRTWNTNYS